MKYFKYLLLFLVIAIFGTVNNVYAESASFYEGELIEGAYLKKFKPGAVTGKYEQMRVFRRSSDHQAAYCIELWTDLILDQEVTGYVTKYAERAGITEEQWQRIQLIAYYGYEYENHTTTNWYAASQYLIWETLEPDSTFYFTDTLNGNPTTKFREEMLEIESLIAEHFKLPSFSDQTYTIPYGKPFVLCDDHRVFHHFEVTSKDSITFDQQDDKLNILPTSLGTFSFQLIKQDTNRKTILYVSPSSQNLIVRGNYPKITSNFKVKVVAGEIVFEKIDKDTKKPIPQGEASFAGTVYELYDSDHHLVYNICFNGSNSVKVDMLPYGTYYVKEVQSGVGYQIDPNEYTIHLDKSKMIVQLEDEVYKSKVVLQKYYGGDTNLIAEEGAEFEVYDSTHHLVSKVTTNTLGIAEIVLPYGTYTFHQIRGKKGFLFVDDFIVQVTDTTPKEIFFHMKNNPLKRYLKVVKKDLESGKNIIIGNAKFRIKNLDTGEYVRQRHSYPNGDMIDVFSTNDKGFFITPEPLSAGKYQLEEVSPPSGYYSIDQPIIFQISEDTEFINDSEYGQVVFLEVFNRRKFGILNIHKLGEVFQIGQDMYYYSYQPLENIVFFIYAEEDIVLGDGTVLYKKGTLVERRETDSDGLIHLSLPFGKYSVVETTFLDQYIKNEKKNFVEISEDSLDCKLNIYNYLKKGSLKIYKKDVNTNLPIPDTYFSVYTDSLELIATIGTDENGIAVLDSLPLGLYYIEEVTSNLNYVLDSTRYSIQIEDEQQVVSFDIYNEPVLPPKTSVDQKMVKRFLFLECFIEISFAFFIVSLRPLFKKKKNHSKNVVIS